MKTIPAVYEHGVFRPTTPVELADGTEVSVLAPEAEVAPQNGVELTESMKRVYAILGERYSSGHHDTAERHNEHQP